MPIYEYQCQNCGRTLEKRQKFSDAALTECPFCGGALEKLISAPAVQFKGGGWFADGYGNKSTASKTGDSNSSPASSTTPASTSSSTPAASTPAPSSSGTTTK